MKAMSQSMNKRNSLKVLLLCIMFAVVFLLAGCGGSGDTADTGAAEQGSTDQLLDYRIVDKAEGAELMLGNKEYYDGFTQNDLDYRMQKKGATMEEYQAFAKEQVLDYTDEQKALLNKCMGQIEQKIRDNGYELPPLDEIEFICTTMAEECDAGAYTHGTQIYMGSAYMDAAIAGDIDESLMESIFAHELFHCLTRCNPDFRAEMYKLIHFTVQEEDFALPPSVKEYFISNPDVEHHNSYATFMIDGKPIDCFAAFVTTKHFEKKGDNFFESGATALVPIDGTDTYWTAEDASNFDEVFGTNTDYVIDPEECMADNFSYLITYGMDGPEGKGYPNPEIIQGIADILTK